jgi:hypothetical protein
VAGRKIDTVYQYDSSITFCLLRFIAVSESETLFVEFYHKVMEELYRYTVSLNPLIPLDIQELPEY